MPVDTARLVRMARQRLQTESLMGVDFVPVAAFAAAGASVAPAPPVATAAPPLDRSLFAGGPAAPELAPLEKSAALEALRARHDAECPHCTSSTTHNRMVFGEGNACARLMFVGEAPGEEEDRTGRPFVGPAGHKLDEMIRAMKLSRQDVYIANVLKTRPPQNRPPLPGEAELCGPYLAEQIRIIRPEVLVALGNPAVKWLLGTAEGITRLRGTWAGYADGAMRIPVMPTFHPAYLLRNYTMDTRTKVWSDLQAVMEMLGGAAGTTP